MRDHYEGTSPRHQQRFRCKARIIPLPPFSTFSKWATGNIFNERPISTQQSGFTYSWHRCVPSLPDTIGGVLWFGTDDANMTVFTPVYCCTDKVPVCYTRVDGADYITFSWNSAFWIFNWVSNMVYPRYDLMIDDVRATQNRVGDNLQRSAGRALRLLLPNCWKKTLPKAKAFLPTIRT